MIGDCKPGTNKCKLAPPTTSDAGGVTSGNKKLADSDDELNLVVSHFCGKCKGSFKRQIPADGINCDGSTSKTHDFGTIELTEDKICTEAKSVYNRF
uniref:CENP-V/GFA domain-containing protein n=1 Tax=Parastrongyloides trichosuri TaxID=131310 RepID=A0A0N4ZVY2_PARTI